MLLKMPSSGKEWELRQTTKSPVTPRNRRAGDAPQTALAGAAVPPVTAAS